MRRGLRIYFAIPLFLCSQFLRAECLNEQQADASLPKLKNAHVYVKSCGRQDLDGEDIFVKIVLKSGKEKELHFSSDNDAYVPTLDTHLSFGDAQNQGVGIGTGSGRGGDGMRYLMISRTEDVIDLGEAPRLEQDPDKKDIYSALVSSSDESYQSIRYFYEVVGNKLSPTKAVGFNPDDNHAVVLMKNDGDDEFKVIKKMHLPEKQYDLCQNGKVSCWK
jgi:hypothetical protein